MVMNGGEFVIIFGMMVMVWWCDGGNDFNGIENINELTLFINSIYNNLSRNTKYTKLYVYMV